MNRVFHKSNPKLHKSYAFSLITFGNFDPRFEPLTVLPSVKDVFEKG